MDQRKPRIGNANLVLLDSLERYSVGFEPMREISLQVGRISSKYSTAQAISTTRKGSIIAVVSIYGKMPRVDLGLVGTLMYQRRDYQKAIELVSKELLHLETMIRRHYAFRQYMEAYRDIDLAQGNIMKVMNDL